jgi:hypothetical protein
LFSLSRCRRRGGKQENRDAEKTVHSLIWMDGRR